MRDITATEIEERKNNMKVPQLLKEEDLQMILDKMLELAGDKTEHGKRQPGEKNKYEQPAV